jgi:hypothetical protein
VVVHPELTGSLIDALPSSGIRPRPDGWGSENARVGSNLIAMTVNRTSASPRAGVRISEMAPTLPLQRFVPQWTPAWLCGFPCAYGDPGGPGVSSRLEPSSSLPKTEVRHYLAKVRVASSGLVSRSRSRVWMSVGFPYDRSCTPSWLSMLGCAGAVACRRPHRPHRRHRRPCRRQMTAVGAAALLYALLLLVRGTAMRFVPGDLRPMRRFARGGCVVARLAYAMGGWRS